eukprot:403371021
MSNSTDNSSQERQSDQPPLFSEQKLSNKNLSKSSPKNPINEVHRETPLFKSFEDKSLEEQAEDITQSLLWNEETPLFTFDSQDHIKRREFTRSLVGAGIFFFMLTAIDLRVLKRMKSAQKMGPLRKLAVLNVLNAPFYYYFYNDITTRYRDMEKHLVTKYLIIGDELLYKKKIV